MSDRKDRIRVHLDGKEYFVVGGGFQDMLAAVKQITGRRFIGELKVWQLPGGAEEIEHQLSISGYELEGGTPIETPAADGQALAQAPATFGDRIRIVVGEHRVAVVGGTFQAMLEVVKSLPDRRFDGNTKVWEIPGDIGVIKGMIETAGFQLEGAENIPIEAPSQMERPQFSSEPPAPPASFEPPSFDADEGAIPPMEPPDWWDDDNMPPPITPDNWDDFPEPESMSMDEPNPFANEPPPMSTPTPTATPPARHSGNDQIRIRLGDLPLVVSGGSFKEMLAAVKNIPGRRFNGQEKIWEIPEDVTLDSVDQAITAAGFSVGPG